MAIIGILAAIAIPNLITAQRRARYSRSAGDTKSLITQAMVVTSDYNLTPVAGLAVGAVNDPSFLWTQPTPAGLPRLAVYMAKVNDPWAPTGMNYRFTESPGVGPGCAATATPGCVVFAAFTVGGDGLMAAQWDGTVGITLDDLGNSSNLGCSFGTTTGIANPC